MMAVEEGDVLMPFEEGSMRDLPPTIMDRCLDNPRGNVLNLFTFCLAMGNAADAVEILCTGFIMTELNASSADKEFLTAAVFIGMFFGGIICGLFSDIYGRRPFLLYSLAINAMAGVASAFAPSVQLLIVCRVIGGIGIGGSVPAVFSLGAEMFAPAVRGKLLSTIASFWMVGAIFVAGAAWLMLGHDSHGNKIIPGSNWHWFAGVCAIPAFTAFLLTLFILPESPRFSIEKLNFDEAAAALNRLSALKTTAQELKIEYYMNKSDDGIFEGTKVEVKASNVPLMFSSRKMTKTSVTLMVIWFTLSFGSYGISTWITTIFDEIGESNPYADAFIFALANLPGNLVSIMLVDKYGRKNLLFFGMVLAGLCSIGFAVLTTRKDMKGPIVFCAAAFNAFSVIGWNSLDCLSVEMFPTAVRTSAMGFLAGSGRIGSVTAQFVNGTLQNNVKVLLLVTSSCMMLGGVFALLLPVDRSGISLTDFTEELEKSDSRRDILTPELCVGEGMDAINPILDYPFSTSSGLKSGKSQTSNKNNNSNNQKTLSDRTYNVIPFSESHQ